MKEINDEKRKDLEAELRCLTSSLSASNSEIGDYRIIKCYEAKLQGKELPYDVDDLISKRQKIRDRINEIQKELESLLTTDSPTV